MASSATSTLSCAKCGKTSTLPVPFDVGAISSVACPLCSAPNAVRSPLAMKEEDMLHELGGDASPLAIEGKPPKDAASADLLSLPCLQLAEFFLTDASGAPVAVEWLGKVLGGPGVVELPRAVTERLAANDAGGDAAAANAVAAEPPDAAVLVRLEAGDEKGERKRKAPAPKPKKEPKPKAPRERKKGTAAASERGDGAAEAAADAAKKADAPPVDSSDEDEDSEEEGESGEEEEETCNWAQCDRCEKWRRLPDGPEYEADALPDQWFCYMNPNTQRNTCDKPEERMDRNETWGEGEDDGEEGEEGEEEDEGADRRSAAGEIKRLEEEAQRIALLQLKRDQAEEEEDGDAEAEGREEEVEAAKPAPAPPPWAAEAAQLASAADAVKTEAPAPAETADGAVKAGEVRGDDALVDDGAAGGGGGKRKRTPSSKLAASIAAEHEEQETAASAAEIARAAKGTMKEAAAKEAATGTATAPAPAAPSVTSTSAWAAALLQKKAEAARQKEAEDARLKAEEEAKKHDPRLEAIAKEPRGHLRLRGVLVPSGFEGDPLAWRYVVSAPLRGWTLQHSGPHRMHSLWVRTDKVWYWLRQAPPTFAPASAGRHLWTPPGSAASYAMPEELLTTSPIAAAYSHGIHGGRARRRRGYGIGLAQPSSRRRRTARPTPPTPRPTPRAAPRCAPFASAPSSLSAAVAAAAARRSISSRRCRGGRRRVAAAARCASAADLAGRAESAEQGRAAEAGPRGCGCARYLCTNGACRSRARPSARRPRAAAATRMRASRCGCARGGVVLAAEAAHGYGVAAAGRGARAAARRRDARGGRLRDRPPAQGRRPAVPRPPPL